MNAKEILELVKGCIRPALVIAFVTVFLMVVWAAVQRYFSAEMGDTAFKTFNDAMLLIIGIYIGGRIAKPPTP